MRVFDTTIPDKPLSNFELERYVKQLEIPNFHGVFMKDTLQEHPYTVECGIVNFNTHTQLGRHWVCYYRNNGQRIYFDLYGQITLVEVQRYLKTGPEFQMGKEVIQRNADIVQAPDTVVHGHLCLYVLKSLSNGETVQDILNDKVIGKIPFKPKKGYVLPRHKFTGTFIPLHLQLDESDKPKPGNEP